jgi:signal transduction histidine kinase
MNTEAEAPFQELDRFRVLLGLTDSSLETLETYRSCMVAKKDLFAQEFYLYLQEIPQTRIYLDHQKYPGRLQAAWSNWFASFFRDNFSEQFLLFQWKSGLRHVEVGIDHPFITLGYSYLRQFCQRTIKTDIPPADREALLTLVDKMVDFCLLVETQAFVEGTAQCDIEIVRGISHQVRNPLMVIGGNIARLQRKTSPEDPAYPLYDTLMAESRRLEAMVEDAATYSEMFQKDVVFTRISLPEVIRQTMEDLKGRGIGDNVEIALNLDPDASAILADRDDVFSMFLHLIRNAVEATDPSHPFVRVSSSCWKQEPSFVEIIIFNTGPSPNADEIATFFLPFSSTKPYGTGFGLSIAQLAARKCLGDIRLEPVTGDGVRTFIKLPAAKKND